MLRVRTIPFGDWNPLRDTLNRTSRRTHAELTRRRAIHNVALFFLSEWKRNAHQGVSGSKPNAPLTMLTKSGSVRGRDTGELAKKIRLHHNSVFTFVGIINGEKLKNGQDAVIVGKSNEFGTIHPRRPKNAKWLSLPLTQTAKIAGSPLKYPGTLEWHVDDDGGHYWKDVGTGVCHYRNVKSVSAIPASMVMQTSLRRTSEVFPYMILQMYKDFFLFRKGRTGKPAVDPYDTSTWTGWRYD